MQHDERAKLESVRMNLRDALVAILDAQIRSGLQSAKLMREAEHAVGRSTELIDRVLEGASQE